MTTQFQCRATHPASFPILPEDMQRSDVSRLLEKVAAAIGLNDGQLRVLLTIVGMTRPSDWTDPTTEPVCYALQGTIACITNKSERQILRIETALDGTFGIIRKDVPVNGHRCRYRRGAIEFRQGLCFTPLIEMVPQLRALADDLEAARFDRKVLKSKISFLKRTIIENLKVLQQCHANAVSVASIAAKIEAWPRRFYSSAPTGEIERHLQEVIAVADELDGIATRKSSMSGPPDIDDGPVQDTTQETTVFCNEVLEDDQKPNTDDVAMEKAQDEAICEPETTDSGRTSNDTDLLISLTPQKLYNLCTEEMKLQVLLAQGDRPHPNQRDFVAAAMDRLRPLDIGWSVYGDAAHQMGTLAAALCILIIDRNRTHPDTPIRNPGGVLRAMTRRHRQNDLHLARSLIALSKRSRSDGNAIIRGITPPVIPCYGPTAISQIVS